MSRLYLRASERGLAQNFEVAGDGKSKHCWGSPVALPNSERLPSLYLPCPASQGQGWTPCSIASLHTRIILQAQYSVCFSCPQFSDMVSCHNHLVSLSQVLGAHIGTFRESSLHVGCSMLGFFIWKKP